MCLYLISYYTVTKERRDARFAALALRASDMGIGSGITSMISFLPLADGEGRRIIRLREKIKHLMVQAPQSIRMIHFRFFIIAFCGL